MNYFAASCFLLALVATSALAVPLSFLRLQSLIDQTKGEYDYDQILPYAAPEAPVVYPDAIDTGSVDDEMTRARRVPMGKRYACRFKFCRIFDA